MKQFNFFYAAAIGFLFLGFIGLLEIAREKVGERTFNKSEKLLLNRWIVADAIEAESNKNLSEEFKTLSWQFMESGGFVAFEEQVIDQTGKWFLKGQELRIRKEGQESLEHYVIDRVNQHELLLSSANLKIRLLKLDD